MTHVGCRRLFNVWGALALVICTSQALIGHAQDASVQVEQFLNAFRGRPVGPVTPLTPAAVVAAQNVAPASRPTTSTPQAAPDVARPDSISNSTCPPGGDRLGCATSSQQRYPTSCPPGTTFGPNGCVPIAMPANAHRVSDDGRWQCDDGYLRYGTVCIPIQSSSSH